LQAQVLQHHLRAGDYRGAKLTDENTALVSRGSDLLDVVRDDLLTLPSRDVLQAVRDGIGPAAATLHARNLRLLGQAFQLDLLTNGTTAEIRPGDVLYAGIRVGHSWLGDFATRIEAFVFRLVCENG